MILCYIYNNLHIQTMNYKCCHGIVLNKLNCLICNPEKRNVCKCNNQKTCELCKVFTPLKKNIDECISGICLKNGIDMTNIIL
jgi:hypothetical protein